MDKIQTPMSGDQARRITSRRKELNLTITQVAADAGMAPSYLTYLESSVTAAPGAAAVLRLAAALHTTPQALAGGTASRPPGPGRAGPHPHLDQLDADTCRTYLSPGGVGRIVLAADRGPVALPVNFKYVDGCVVFRTEPHSVVATAVPAIMSFEVDNIDETMSEGWSVLVTGTTRLVTDASEVANLQDADIEAWAGGDRSQIIVLTPQTITGRRVTQELDVDGAAHTT
jgi:transcriptional regulator with XRE-family HTH domain